jgi:hypothetical protein
MLNRSGCVFFPPVIAVEVLLHATSTARAEDVCAAVERLMFISFSVFFFGLLMCEQRQAGWFRKWWFSRNGERLSLSIDGKR